MPVIVALSTLFENRPTLDKVFYTVATVIVEQKTIAILIKLSKICIQQAPQSRYTGSPKMLQNKH